MSRKQLKWFAYFKNVLGYVLNSVSGQNEEKGNSMITKNS